MRNFIVSTIAYDFFRSNYEAKCSSFDWEIGWFDKNGGEVDKCLETEDMQY